MTPIFKKGDKQLIKNYKRISLLPICGKMFEKLISNHLYSYLHTNYLITKNQSGFRPGDYYILLMKFIKLLTALDHLKLEQYFSIFLKLLTRCGMRDWFLCWHKIIYQTVY